MTHGRMAFIGYHGRELAEGTDDVSPLANWIDSTKQSYIWLTYILVG
jgi:hypothetical protein